MANATVLRSSLTAIIPRLRTQLAAVTGLPEGRVRYVARQQKTPHFSAPRELLIEDAGFEAARGNSDRHDCRLLRRLAGTIRTRCELGEADADEPWALGADEGNIAFGERRHRPGGPQVHPQAGAGVLAARLRRRRERRGEGGHVPVAAPAAGTTGLEV